MPIFYLELFKTLILNFGYINSKHRKLGMFILTEIPIYLSKQGKFATNFLYFQFLNHVTCHVSIINVQAVF